MTLEATSKERSRRESRRSSKRSEAIIAIAVHIPILLIRLSFLFLRLQSKRRSAVRAFKRELESLSVGKEHAELLARKYESAGSLRNLLEGFGNRAVSSLSRRG